MEHCQDDEQLRMKAVKKVIQMIYKQSETQQKKNLAPQTLVDQVLLLIRKQL